MLHNAHHEFHSLLLADHFHLATTKHLSNATQRSEASVEKERRQIISAHDRPWDDG